MDRFLTTAQPPWFLVTRLSPSDLGSMAYKWTQRGFTARFLRGHKMMNTRSLFDEASAVLQFPYYFGENWAAFDECIADLSWLPAGRGYLFVLLSAHKVLADDPDELSTFVDILNRAAVEWAEPVSVGEVWDRPAVPFHVVLQFPEGRNVKPQRWSASGADSAALT